MKRRIACIIFDFLSLASIVGVLVLQHFATTRMGMIRWLNSYNRGIESSMPLDFLTALAVIITAGFLIASVYLSIKNKQMKKALTIVKIVAAALCLICVLYVIFGTTTKTFRIHYFAILLFSMASSFTSISNIIRLFPAKTN